MRIRQPYCRDRMCGATDCSNCYGPGYDRDDDDEPEEEDEEDAEENEDDPDDAPELPMDAGQ